MDIAFGLVLVLFIVIGLIYAALHGIFFVVTMIGRFFIGMGRMVVGPSTCGGPTAVPERLMGLEQEGQKRSCRNPRCQSGNLPTARYCARCGQPLGSA